MNRIYTFLAALFIAGCSLFSTATHAQSSFSGNLYQDSFVDVAGSPYDWVRGPMPAAQRSTLTAGGSAAHMFSQARFDWPDTCGGSPCATPVGMNGDEHPIVAFVQGNRSNTHNNDAHIYDGTGNARQLWNYGAGAIMQASGLVIEVWYLENGTNKAMVVGTDNNRCMTRVPDGHVYTDWCAGTSATTATGAGYVTTPPAGWTVDKSAYYYWITVELSNYTGGESGTILARLYDQHKTTGAVRLLQEASTPFTITAFMPYNSALNRAYGLASGSSTIQFHAFD